MKLQYKHKQTLVNIQNYPTVPSYQDAYKELLAVECI